MSDDEHLRGDGLPPRMAARRSEGSRPPRWSRSDHEQTDDRWVVDRRTLLIAAAVGLLAGLLVVGPTWERVGWPLAAAGLLCLVVLAVVRRLALTRSAIAAMRRVDQSFELLWHLAGWAVVGAGILVIGSGGVASGVALVAASLANMATNHRVGALAVGVTGLALGALGVSYVLADRALGGFLLVAVAAAVVVLGVVIFMNTGRAGGGRSLPVERSDVSRRHKR